MQEKISTLRKKISDIISKNGGEIFRYLVIGVCTTAINYLVYTFFVKILSFEDFKWGITAANCIAIPVSIIFAYAANKLFVFRSKCDSAKAFIIEMAGFFSSRALTMVIEVFGVELLVKVLHFDPMVGKAIIQIIVIVLNYIFGKFIVFRKKHRSEE